MYRSNDANTENFTLLEYPPALQPRTPEEEEEKVVSVHPSHNSPRHGFGELVFHKDRDWRAMVQEKDGRVVGCWHEDQLHGV